MANFNEKKDNKMITKIVSISLSLGEAQGTWKQHSSNFVAQIVYLLAQFGTDPKFGLKKFALHCCQLSEVIHIYVMPE